LSLHTATRRQGRIRGAGDMTLRDASSRATKVFYPAMSMCDLIFSGVFERHPRLTVAIVEFELAWVPHVLSTMDYTYRERQGEAIYRFKDAMLPSDFFHRKRGTGIPGGRHRYSSARHHRRGQHNVGLGLSTQRVDVSAIAEDPGGDPGRRAGRRTGQDRRRQHRPRLQFRRGAASTASDPGLARSSAPRRQSSPSSKCSSAITDASRTWVQSIAGPNPHGRSRLISRPGPRVAPRSAPPDICRRR